MSNKDNTANQGNDGTTTNNKGESQQSHQKGAKSVAKHDTGKHKKDDSDGDVKQTTKKQSNSI
ncbi:MAG: hypothetical protein JWQ96_2126 [Segetibacter sp.]|nr:hypothetical protein [Segetibacter sp.]